MKIPKQVMPIKGARFIQVGIQPSECPQGDLMVVLPNGKTSKLKGAIECKYSYPKCTSVLKGKNPAYDKLIGQQFTKECGLDNSKDCYYWTKCRLIGD